MKEIAVVANRMIDEFFDDSIFFRNMLSPASIFNNVLTKKLDYPVDIFREKDGGLRIEVVIVGHDKNNVKVSTTNNSIRIKSGEPNKLNSESVYRGICRKSFNYEWKLTDRYDLSAVKATADNGVLSVIIPSKKEREKHPRQIEIN